MFESMNRLMPQASQPTQSKGAPTSATKANASSVAALIAVLVAYWINLLPGVDRMPPEVRGALVTLAVMAVGWVITFYAPPNRVYADDVAPIAVVPVYPPAPPVEVVPTLQFDTQDPPAAAVAPSRQAPVVKPGTCPTCGLSFDPAKQLAVCPHLAVAPVQAVAQRSVTTSVAAKPVVAPPAPVRT